MLRAVLVADPSAVPSKLAFQSRQDAHLLRCYALWESSHAWHMTQGTCGRANILAHTCCQQVLTC